MNGAGEHSDELNGDFNKLWGASGLSNLADGVGLTAAPLLAASLTRDPLLVAGLTFAQRLPWFMFTLISGALVDRLDRRQVMERANLSRFLLLGGLACAVLFGWVTLPLLYLVYFLLGTIETLFDNAALAILPTIVAQERLEESNGRLFASGTLANELIGPPLGSFLYSTLQATSFLSAALAFGLSSWLIHRITGNFRSAKSSASGFLLDIKQGWTWFWRHHLLRSLSFFAASFNFVFGATMGVFVLFAQDVLGVSEAAYGLILSTGAIGGIAGSLVVKRLSDRFGPGHVLLADALVNGLSFFFIGLTSRPVVAGLLFALISMSNMFGNVIIVSLRQAIIPDHLLGRVASAYRLVVLGALPVGALVGGVLARNFDLRTPFISGGILLVVVGVVVQPVINNQTIQQARAAAAR